MAHVTCSAVGLVWTKKNRRWLIFLLYCGCVDICVCVCVRVCACVRACVYVQYMEFPAEVSEDDLAIAFSLVSSAFEMLL